MKATLRRALQRKRDQQAEKLVQEVLALDDAPDIKAQLDRINSYSSLLSVSESLSHREWMWPAAITCFCLAVVGILWSVHVSRTDVSLSLDTTSVRASLIEPWQFENVFRSSLMHFERLSAINAPNLGISIEPDSGDAWLALEGGQIALQSLQVKPNALIEILNEDNAVDLYTSRAPLVGRVSVLGKVTVTAGPKYGVVTVHHSFDISIPETIDFSVDDPQDIPTQISVHDPAKWSLSRLPYSQISFTREEVSGAAQRAVRSGITKGTIRFNDTSWPVLDVREGDLLRVNETASARIETRGESGVMHVALNGLVGNVTVGDSEASKDLAPSYLEYLYNRKSLVFVWTTIVFLWGLIWRVSRAIFG